MAGKQFIFQADMFDNEKIKIIQARPKGDTLLIIWIRLTALAEKCGANGLVRLEDGIPYTARMLAAVFNKSPQMVNLALATFEELHMIENTTGGICIINENQDNKEDRTREQNRIRKQRERGQKKGVAAQAAECENVTEMSRSVTGEIAEMSRDMSHSVTGMSRGKEEKERTKEKEEKKKEVSSEEDTKKSPPGKEPLRYQQIMDDYNRTCTSFTPISVVSDGRKRKIRTLVDGMDRDKILPGKSTYERLHTLFQHAQASDFLSGRDGCWTGCSFDWIINKANALKVLEGTYNKAGKAKAPQKPAGKLANKFCGFPQRDYDFAGLEQQILSTQALGAAAETAVAPVQL